MSARIAPESVSAVVVPVSDYRPRTSGAVEVAPIDAGGGPQNDMQPGQRFADVLPPLPPPPDPPGLMFAAALVAGALSPKPETAEEVFLRLGKDWSAPESQLHLADRTV
mgnify:CR=1 FL=1